MGRTEQMKDYDVNGVGELDGLQYQSDSKSRQMNIPILDPYDVKK